MENDTLWQIFDSSDAIFWQKLIFLNKSVFKGREFKKWKRVLFKWRWKFGIIMRRFNDGELYLWLQMVLERISKYDGRIASILEQIYKNYRENVLLDLIVKKYKAEYEKTNKFPCCIYYLFNYGARENLLELLKWLNGMFDLKRSSNDIKVAAIIAELSKKLGNCQMDG